MKSPKKAGIGKRVGTCPFPMLEQHVPSCHMHLLAQCCSSANALHIMDTVFDPFKSNFGTVSERACAKCGNLVARLLSSSGHQEKILLRLGGPMGRFNDYEACEILADIFDKIAPMPSHAEHMWASGVLLYFLLSGYQFPTNKDQAEFHRESRLGVDIGSTRWNQMFEQGHWRTVRGWENVSNGAKKFIMDLTSCRPERRPCLLSASNHEWMMTSTWVDSEDEFLPDPMRMARVNEQKGGMARRKREQHNNNVSKNTTLRNATESSKKRLFMDINSFKSIVSNPEEDVKKTRAEQEINPMQKKNAQAWKTFMKKSARSSRKSKGKHRAAKRRQKQAEKQLKDKNTEEFWALHHKTNSDEEWRLTEEDWDRCHHLKYEAMVHEDQLPSWFRQGPRPNAK